MNFNRSLILASSSPRRQEILKNAGFSFRVKVADVEETFPTDLDPNLVAQYLAVKKSKAIPLEGDEVVVTSDTTVIVDGDILNKPKHRGVAQIMLRKLSGRDHKVVTGVAITDRHKTIEFSETTYVSFKNLSDEEIDYYIDRFQPFDKAGSYGIQEWIGMIGITEIKGSYFNVMGLPIHKLYEELMKF
ncbi:MAG: Maf family nucleotide pyrophosphatase [Bacteroidota bacterium]